MTIQKIGIIGAGQMGNGIAHVVALAGYDVALNDLTKERVEAALATINGNLSRQVGANKISEDDMKTALGRISYAEVLRMCLTGKLAIPTPSSGRTVFGAVQIVVSPRRGGRAGQLPLVPFTTLQQSAGSVARSAAVRVP